MRKNRTHLMSKTEFPTIGTSVGHKLAEKALERKLGRKLRPGTKIKTKAGNWAFIEPKGKPSEEKAE